MNHYLPFIIFTVSVITCVKCAYIQNNAYKGISISFSPKVQLPRLDFEKLKHVLRNASQVLYHATRRRSYFGEFVFSVPSSWTSDDVNDICESFTQKAPQSIDIYVTDIPSIPELKTQHSKTCGKPGDVIYMPKFWYRSGDMRDLARQFVQQWSIFRYGVFEEYSERSGACFASSQSAWSPVGCYNAKFNAEVTFDEGGIPQCYFSDDFFQREEFNSSIMTFHNLSEVIHFCDGTKKHPHNPIMPTLHNNLCQGRNTWSIIQNSEDFVYGRNASRSDEELQEKTIFRCFREPVLHVTFAIQNSTYKTSKDNEYKAFLEAIVELRYALLHFLSNMAPKESIVDLLTFSDAPITEAGNAVQLDLSKKDELEDILDNRIGMENITKICLLCGLRKALNVSQTNGHPFPIVVLIAWESALVGEKISDLTEELKKYPDVVFHLILVEDTNSDVLPSTFVDAVRRTRGQIFNLAKEMVIMSTELNQALASVFKSPLHIEDNILVLHQKTYVNVKSNIVDAFTTHSGAMGELLYMMHCNDNDMISSMNVSCETWDQKSSTFKCGEISSLTDNKSSQKVWAYSFKYSIRPIPLICSSIAMLKVTSASDNSFTLRGWLNEDKITPGYNVLIIYAEVIKLMDQDFRVEARISGPKLDSIPMELRDNGNGDPDMKKGDNIYSRYFTSFAEKGTYTVTIYVETLHGKQSWIAEGNTDKFSQTKVIGSFTVMESAPNIDIYPPNKIGDLKLLSVNPLNRTVTLQWTAPGNDYDSGKAMNYELKYSIHWTNLLEIAFEEEGKQLESISERVPLPAGETETFATTFPNIAGNVFVALRARDEKQNVAMVSNIVQLHIKEDTITTSAIFKTDINTFSTAPTSDFESTFNTTEEITDVTESSTEITDSPTTNTSLNMDDYVKKSFVIIVVGSVAGGILLLIIVINVIVYYCCLKKYKKSKPPRNLPRKASLRPPYNLNVAYRDSKSSFDTEHDPDESINSLPDQNMYPDPRARSSQRRYSYHTSRSLLEQKRSAEKDLGFKLVQTMPAYATTSLSRVRNYDNGSDLETKGAIPQPQRPKSAVDPQIYPLGIV
ncbi:calcium-activated chloride channel regulator 4A-like [Uloborus diversus]|uniref:calcium-activated chloride channel regulator 4A-like n=1 Tax=Uloborus diversus TaxID=327109 RepID=UPI0024094A58|nr:calcium-activated chloride channel regulator 4A-like [Uloborus diversus]